MTTTAEVPGRYPIGINGVGYMLEEDGEQPAIVHQSIRTQREQTASQGNIGEAVVNPEGFWRRSISGWYHGAGQSYADRAESDPLRFRTSSGVDVFSTRHQATLLNTTTREYTAAGDVFVKQGSETSVIIRDGQTIKKVSSVAQEPTWTTVTVTGIPTSGGGSASRGLAVVGPSGGDAYASMGTDGIYSFQTDASTGSASFITGTVKKVFYAKGRLIAVNGQLLYNPTAAGALPSALATLSAPMEWIDVAEGKNHIYLLASDKFTRTIIYKTTIKPDGTALDVPTVAGELPMEKGRALFSHSGYLFPVTDRGNGSGWVRMAEADDNGNLEFGSPIPLVTAPGDAAGVGAGRFVWVGSNGAGPLLRLDLSQFTARLTPAYANDLVPVPTSGTAITSLIALGAWNSNAPLIFAAASAGVFRETSTPVASGTIDSGLLAIDLAETKTAVALDVEAAYPSTSSITEALSVDRGASFTAVDTFDAADQGEAAVTGIAASRNFELRTTLTAAGANSPTLFRHTLKAEPNVNQSRYRIYRLLLHEDVVDYTSSRTGRSPSTDVAALEALQEARTVVEVQEGDVTFNGTIRDMDFVATSRCASADDGSHNGVATVRVKELPA